MYCKTFKCEHLCDKMRTLTFVYYKTHYYRAPFNSITMPHLAVIQLMHVIKWT